MKPIDLRSDTMTYPDANMRKAMSEAELGDAVFGEDPTVNRLEQMCAEVTGKQAALFVASGTMGNLVSMLTHCRRGDEVIAGDRSHAYHFEQGGMAVVGGIHARSLPMHSDGTMDIDQIRGAVNKDDQHYARTRLICLENTFNGRILKQSYVAQVKEIADKHDLRMHLDGARIFNAAVAQKKSVRELVEPFDSVQFCLSKGLGTPVGSMICSSTEFIREAIRNRKLVGGGMRQAGVLAAAGIYALENMVDRLAEDHENARRLAAGMQEIPGVTIEPGSVETNILLFSCAGQSASQLVAKMDAAGLRMLPMGPNIVRAVTHFGIEKEDIDKAIEIIGKVLAPARTASSR